MTIRENASLVGMAVVAGMLVFAGYGWVHEHDARLKAEAQTGQQQRQIEDIKSQQATVERALDGRLADIEQERRQPATAAQIVSDSTRLWPKLAEPLRAETVADNPELPNGPVNQRVVIPQADFGAMRDAQLNCEEDSTKLNACEALREGDRQQLKLTEIQRDEWKSTAKGGALWHRAIGAAKWFAVGAGAGAAAYAIAHHR